MPDEPQDPSPRVAVQTATRTPDAVSVLRTAEGAEALLERAGGVEVLRLRDRQGRTVIEYRPADGTAVISVPGDLELRADQGSVRIHARDGVEVQSATVAVRTREARLEAGTVSTVAERVRQVVGVLDTQAVRILERAREMYSTVEDLAQTKAGRLRLVAQGTLHAMGAKLHLKAREDVKVKGEKIYLA